APAHPARGRIRQSPSRGPAAAVLAASGALSGDGRLAGRVSCSLGRAARAVCGRTGSQANRTIPSEIQSQGEKLMTPDTDAQAPVRFERRYENAEVQDLWELWTTKEGFESWWGPQGFRVQVHKLDLREGGELLY